MRTCQNLHGTLREADPGGPSPPRTWPASPCRCSSWRSCRASTWRPATCTPEAPPPSLQTRLRKVPGGLLPVWWTHWWNLRKLNYCRPFKSTFVSPSLKGHHLFWVCIFCNISPFIQESHKEPPPRVFSPCPSPKSAKQWLGRRRRHPFRSEAPSPPAHGWLMWVWPCRSPQCWCYSPHPRRTSERPINFTQTSHALRPYQVRKSNPWKLVPEPGFLPEPARTQQKPMKPLLHQPIWTWPASN